MGSAKFAEAIEVNDILKTFDEFHKQMTGMVGYCDDEWNAFRTKLCLSGRKCVIECEDSSVE